MFCLLLRVCRDSAADKPGEAAEAASNSSNSEPQPQQQDQRQDREAGETLLLQQLAATFGVSSAHPRSAEMSLLEASLKVRKTETSFAASVCMPPFHL